MFTPDVSGVVRSRGSWIRQVAATLALVASAYTGIAAEDVQIRITSTSVSTDRSTLFVFGERFGTTPPKVTLNDQVLAGVTVDATGTTLSALMPAIGPGLYRVVVRPQVATSLCVSSSKDRSSTCTST